MNTTDHHAEAGRALNESSLLNEWTTEERLILATRAQAEATLALADEQRTTNLLTLFNSLTDGDSLTFLGERVDGYDLARSIKARLTTVKAEAGEVVVPAPTLPTKAVGSKDSYYLRTAARNIQQGYNVGGSGVTNMIITLLTDTAAAMEAEGN